MLFNSLLFLVFFPLVVAGFYLLPHKYRWAFLLGASYYFYMNWKPIYALLLFFSTAVTWTAASFINRERKPGRKKTILVASITANLLILWLYKYYNFINSTVSTFFELLGLRWEVPNLDLLLPVGISFYTFQAIGYTVDVYRGQVAHEKHFGRYALFVSFFPQLVAGPIERASNLLPQFRQRMTFSSQRVGEGLRMMLWGFFLKLAMADNLSEYVDAVFAHVESHSSGTLALASVFFSFQIYGDFAGYSLIAIGVARCLGFELMMNFRRPYFASSVTAFWSRWHISLSTWFKDYLYIPLGGNRNGHWRTYRNLFLTFFVSGIWHGANFTFIVWGALHGLFVVMEKIGRAPKEGKHAFSLQYLLQVIATFFLVTFAWIFFRAASLTDALIIYKKLFTERDYSLFIQAELFVIGFIALTVLLIKEIGEEFFPEKFALFESPHVLVRYTSLALVFLLLLLIGTFDNSQFIYFQF
ncbi:MAG: MBOAT family O-acyltransferase [Nitritalea sp.]